MTENETTPPPRPANESKAVAPPPPPAGRPDWFNEEAYLKLNPDIASAVTKGVFKSGYEHYASAGWAEKRNLFLPGGEPRDRIVEFRVAPPEPGTKSLDIGNIEIAHFSRGGGILIVGWASDRFVELNGLKVATPAWEYTFSKESISRIRRRDVEQATGATRPSLFGFFAFAFLDRPLEIGPRTNVSLLFSGNHSQSGQPTFREVDDVEMRDLVMSYVGHSETIGNQQLGAAMLLDGRLGPAIIRHNRHLVNIAKASPYVAYFGTPERPLRGSIIVCLFGKPEFLFLQQALFSNNPGMDEYEFIYVCNSPELAETLMAEAKLAHLTYGLPITLILLSSNAGFGAANNVASAYARSHRLLIMNPDVFPRHRDWARRHTDLVASADAARTTLFGVPLFYDDGSLMHAGMHFEFDELIDVRVGSVTRHRMVRVEHFGKGAPPDTPRFLESKQVQAVTGAFISVDRGWFEFLGGFTEDFVFGHYEDADLCLKSVAKGCSPWLNNIQLWHLEGKGSTRLPAHEGGSTVNRWLFTRRWTDFLLKDGAGAALSEGAR